MTGENVIREIDWTISPDIMKQTTEDTLEAAKIELDKIAKTPEGEEGLETLLKFEEMLASTGERLSPFIFMKYVSLDKKQREAGHETEQESQKFNNMVWSRSDVYEVVARLEPEMDSYGEEEAMLLKRTLEEFRHRGAALEKDIRNEFLEIANNISVRASEFNKTLNEITDKIRCTVEELDGVPADIYKELEKEGDEYLLPLDYPVYLPVMRYAKNPATRKKMNTAFLCRGGKENTDLLLDTLALRERQAKLLGYSTFADYEISRKMAKTPKRVFDFMYDLREKLAPLRDKEIEYLRELKSKELEIPLEETTLENWDYSYYHYYLLRNEYSIDQNVVKEYFPVENVIEGVLEVYQTVLNLEFKKTKDPDVWHEDITEYLVYDKVSGDLMGKFYLDLFPREGKFKHYAVFPMLERRSKDGEVLLPITAMVGNFAKPTGGKPALLTHDELETFFHEFGHLMHVISNTTKYDRFGLDGVLPDFIEVPSQMLENWAWKEEVLNLISGHYEDSSKKLPADLLKRMLDAKLLNVGIFQTRQIFYALIDMLYHTQKVDDPTEEFHKLYKDITGFEMPDGTFPEAGFGHLMGGYEAGYYSYMWSKVYAEDLFTKFEENGFMDESTGLEYREKIMAPGGSRDPDEMVREFLRRESNNEAFLKSIGIDIAE